MADLVRTTITVPNDIYRQAKVLAAAEDMSLSKLISKVLKVLVRGESVDISDPMKSLGSLSLGIKQVYKSREDLYAERLDRKMGN